MGFSYANTALRVLHSIVIRLQKPFGTAGQVESRRYADFIQVTTTSTSTTTVTTLYAACATNNLADSYMSTPFGEVTGGFSSVYDTNATDAYDWSVVFQRFNATELTY